MVSPFGGFDDFGIGGLSRGTVVALAKGRYDAALRLPSDRSVWGACAAETELWSSVPHRTDAVVESLGTGVEVRRIRIGRSDRPGVLARMADRSIHLEAVEVSDVIFVGVIVVNGATGSAHELVVRDMRSRDLEHGRGILVQHGSRFELRRGVVERARENGVYVDAEAAIARLEDVAVIDTQPEEITLADGDGAVAVGGARLELARVALVGNRNFAVGITTEGSTLDAEDLWVSGTRPHAGTGVGGVGLGAGGGVVDVRRATFEAGREAGLAVGSGATASFADVVSRDHRGRENDGEGGYGLYVRAGGAASMTRAAILRNRRGGISVSDGSELELTDAVVAETDQDEALGVYGRGLNVQIGSTATVSRALVEDNQAIGVHVGEGARATLADVVVRGTRSSSLGYFGRGLGVFGGSTVDVSRAVVEDHRDVGVYGWDAGAQLTLRDVVVRGLIGVDCAGCSPGGTGIGAYLAASVSVERFVIEDAVLCGVMVARDGELDLTAGVVSRCTVGACVAAPEYDVARLTDDVVYTDNGNNLDATELPLPEPLTEDLFGT
jgi:hypothetical protein